MWLLTGILTLCTAFAVGARGGWPLELFSHFRPQYALLSILLFFVSTLLNAWPVALFAAALAAFHLAPLRAYLPRTQDPEERLLPGQGLRVAHCNLWERKEALSRFADQVADYRADVVLLTSMPKTTNTELERLFPHYPYHVDTGGGRPSDVLLLSRFPINSFETVEAPGRRPVLIADVRLAAPADSGHVRLLSLHPPSPLYPLALTRRDEMLEIAEKAAEHSPWPCLLVGDLNATVFAPRLAALLASGKWSDAAVGRGFAATWFHRSGLLGLRIDHLFYTDEVDCTDYRVGENVTSDHYPVFGAFRIV